MLDYNECEKVVAYKYGYNDFILKEMRELIMEIYEAKDGIVELKLDDFEYFNPWTRCAMEDMMFSIFEEFALDKRTLVVKI